jgi:hypothetical protein
MIPGDWPPAADEVWLVMGSMGAVVSALDDDGTVIRGVALRLEAHLNLDPRNVIEERTFVLDEDHLVELIAGLMMCGTEAFGSASMMRAFGDRLGVRPDVRQATIAAVERAIDELER